MKYNKIRWSSLLLMSTEVVVWVRYMWVLYYSARPSLFSLCVSGCLDHELFCIVIYDREGKYYLFITIILNIKPLKPWRSGSMTLIEKQAVDRNWPLAHCSTEELLCAPCWYLGDVLCTSFLCVRASDVYLHITYMSWSAEVHSLILFIHLF